MITMLSVFSGMQQYYTIVSSGKFSNFQECQHQGADQSYLASVSCDTCLPLLSVLFES